MGVPARANLTLAECLSPRVGRVFNICYPLWPGICTDCTVKCSAKPDEESTGIIFLVQMREVRPRQARSFPEVTRPARGEVCERPGPPRTHHAAEPLPQDRPGAGCYQEMGAHRVPEQETRVLALVLPPLSPCNYGVLTCNIGAVTPFLRSSGSPYVGPVRPWALRYVERAGPEHRCACGGRRPLNPSLPPSVTFSTMWANPSAPSTAVLPPEK